VLDVVVFSLLIINSNSHVESSMDPHLSKPLVFSISMSFVSVANAIVPIGSPVRFNICCSVSIMSILNPAGVFTGDTISPASPVIRMPLLPIDIAIQLLIHIGHIFTPYCVVLVNPGTPQHQLVVYRIQP